MVDSTIPPASTEPAVPAAERVAQAVNMNYATAVLTTLRDPKLSPLELYLQTRKLQQLLSDMQMAILVEANNEFTKLPAVEGGEWRINDCTLTKNTGKGTWKLSAELNKEVADLKVRVDAYKKANPLSFTGGGLDPKKKALFKVSLPGAAEEE